MEFNPMVIRRRDETKFVLDFGPKIDGAAVPNDVVPANSVISVEPGKYFFVRAESGSSTKGARFGFCADSSRTHRFTMSDRPLCWNQTVRKN